MAGKLQLRRGNTSQNDNFTGAVGEITVNISEGRVRIHDGQTQGGFAELANLGDITEFGNGLGSAAWLDANYNPVADDVARYNTGGRLKTSAAIDSNDAVNKLYASENYEQKKLNNTDATTDPTANDDADDGYSIFSKWVNQSTGDVFECLDNTVGSANWVLGNITADDLGSAALRDIGTGSTQIPLNSDLATVSQTGNYADLLNKPAVDNYQSWSFQVNSGGLTPVQSGDSIDFTEGANVTLTQTGNSIEIKSTDTTYTAGTGITLSGGSFSLSGVSYTQVEKDKLSGIESGAQANIPANLSIGYTASSVSINNSNGSGFDISSARETTAGLLDAAGRKKLNDIETNADVTDTTNVAAAGAVMDSDFTANGLMKRTDAGVYTSITDNSGNWNTAFSWGDHSQAGYALASSLSSVATTGSYNDLTNKPTLNINDWDTAYSWGDHALAGYADATAVNSGLSGKVDKVAGKALSSNDFTDGLLAELQANKLDRERQAARKKLEENSVIHLDFKRNIGYSRPGIDPNDWHGAIDGGDAGVNPTGHPGSATALLDYTCATTATGQTADGRIVEVAANTPRLVGNGGEAVGLLNEPSGENLLLWSEDFTQPAWQGSNTQGVTITSGSEDVNGTNRGVNLVCTESEGRLAQVIGIAANNLYSVSFWIRANALTGDVRIIYGDLNSVTITQDLVVGKWVKIELTREATGTTGRFYLLMDGVGDDINVCFPQLEPGYPTSYIPTTTTSGVRGVTSTTKDITTNAGRGTLFFDGLVNSQISGRIDLIAIGETSGAITNAIKARINPTNGEVDFLNISKGSVAIDSPSTNIALGVRHKIAVVFFGTTLKGYIDGKLVYSNTSDFVAPDALPVMSVMGNIFSDVSLNGYCKAASCSSKPLTQAEAIALTTLEP